MSWLAVEAFCDFLNTGRSVAVSRSMACAMHANTRMSSRELFEARTSRLGEVLPDRNSVPDVPEDGQLRVRATRALPGASRISKIIDKPSAGKPPALFERGL